VQGQSSGVCRDRSGVGSERRMYHLFSGEEKKT